MDGPANALISVGIPANSAHFVAALLASTIASWALTHVPTVTGRHLFSTATGLLLSFYAYGWATGYLLASCAGSYAVLLTTRRYCGPITAVGTITYLIYCHILAGSSERWKSGLIPFTGGMMTLVQRLSSIAFDYQDGDARVKARTPHAEENKLEALPGPVEYMGYLFYPGSVMVGPWMAASKYFAFVRREGLWARPAPQGQGRRVPSGWPAFAERMAYVVLSAALFVTLKPRFPPIFADPAFVARSLPFKLGYMWCMELGVRCRFYFAWKVAEAANCLSGLGFVGWDARGRANWDGGRNVAVLAVEFPSTAAELAKVWNTATGEWLRFYFYERLCPPPAVGRALLPPPAALLLTQAVAGVWHGLRPGQLLFFAHSVPMLLNAKALFRLQRGLPARLAAPARLAHSALSLFVINYLALAFVDNTWEGTLAAWGAIGFCGHWALGAATLLALVARPPPKAARDGPEVKKKVP